MTPNLKNISAGLVLQAFLLCSSTHLALAAAGDENWDSIIGVPGLSGGIWTMDVVGDKLYAGGNFLEIGGINASNIALWDGTNWSTLGSGIDGGVFGMASSGTDLYVAGGFSQAGGRSAASVAKWDGTNWCALGTGVNGGVRSLAVMGSQLFAGGNFGMAGGAPASNIAVWDGSAWAGVSGGVNGSVTTLATDGMNLYVGGAFSQAGSVAVTNVAKWDGQSWSAMGDPEIAPPAAIRLRGSQVFLFALRSPFQYETSIKLIKWGGTSWVDVASGELGLTYCNDCGVQAWDMVMAGNDIYVCGFFDGGVQKRNGAGWSQLGSGLWNNGIPTCLSLTSSGSELYVGGGSFHTAGGKPSERIALWHIPHALSASVSGNILTLSWPATGSNFVLEANASLVQSNWSSVSPSPVIMGDQLVVTNEISGGEKFYRLRRR